MITRSKRVLKVFESFVLGICNCGCNKNIKIRNKKGMLGRYEHGHNRPFKKGDLNIKWKGGRSINPRGYVLILKHDYYKKNCIGYVKEHIYNFENHYQCCLLKWGCIHHIDHDKTNNKIENLQGMTQSQHTRMHNLARLLET